MRVKSESCRDERDRKLFDRIAFKYSRKDIYLPTRRARQFRLSQTIGKNDINQFYEILEIGCGAGFAATYLKDEYRKYVGIDHSRELIDIANIYNKSERTSFYTKDLYKLKSVDRYDLVFMIGVLHHIANMKKALEKILSLLKPGGLLIVNEPQKANVFISYLRKIRSKIDNSYSDDQEELDNKELIKLFRNIGFVDLESYPQGILSTPFAEVILKPEIFAKSISCAACFCDNLIERRKSNKLRKISWNTVIKGKKPAE